MSTHYNAFISYKHEPKDTRIAEKIQKDLEHYQIPGKIKKATGVNKINRIFRDKSELPLTSDLSETILEALNNSDYLIVICSPKTKESIWVEREIEFFLRTHSKKQVLTVLVEGEPADVIPEILLKDEKLVYNEYGNIQTINIDLEPLSCDYRMSLLQAKRQELPRLASALIGCTYDDLMNRNRQYRMRRVALAFTAILLVSYAFAAYMFHSRKQIQDNYITALANQSRYLANESEYLFEGEQRMTALQVALEALPSGKNDKRPVTPEAVKALIKANYSYVGRDDSTICTDCNYILSSNISSFDISANGKYLVAKDIDNNIAVWNTYDHSQIFFRKVQTSATTSNVCTYSDNIIIYYSDTTLYCYNANTKENIWDYELTDDIFSSNSLTVSKNYIMVSTVNNKVILLNPKDGSVFNECTIPSDSFLKDSATPTDADTLFSIATDTDADNPFFVDLDSSWTSINNYLLSPDETKILFSSYNSANGFEILGCYDIKSDKVVFSDKQNCRFTDYMWIDNDQIVCATLKDTLDSSMELGSTKILTTNNKTIICYDVNSFKEKWTNSISSNEPITSGVLQNNSFLYIKASETLSYYYGDAYIIMDAKTGKAIFTDNINSSIIYSFEGFSDHSPVFITESGCMCTLKNENGKSTTFMTKYFMDDIDSFITKNGIAIAHPDGLNEQLISYRNYIYDDEWESIKLSSGDLSSLPSDYAMDENALALGFFADKPTLIVVNIENGKYDSVKIPLEEDEIDSYKILGIYDDVVYIINNNDNPTLYKYDIKSGDLSSELLHDSYISYLGDLSSDMLLPYISRDKDFNEALYIHNIKTGETNEISLKNDNDDDEDTNNTNDETDVQKIKVFETPVILPGSDYVFISDDSMEYILNTKTKEKQPIKYPKDWVDTVNVSTINELGLFVLSNNRKILLVDTTGNIKISINQISEAPKSVNYIKTISGEEQLLVFNQDCTLYRYDPNNGRFLGSTSLSKELLKDGMPLYNNKTLVTYDSMNSIVYLQYDDTTCVIDTNRWVEYFSVGNCFGHHMKSDRFLTVATSDPDKSEPETPYCIGYFKHYTLDELIKKAQGQINGNELTESQKSMYGISSETD